MNCIDKVLSEKEIDDLLKENNELKDKVKELSGWDKNKDTRNSRQRITIKNLLKKNQQLKEQLNKYTDPKDLTLMFMYCDEKAKDKIKCLEQENQQLKEQIEKYQLQNFNLKQDIMIKKISFPNKKIRDKSLIGLYNMPSYEDLKRENQQLKEQLESSIGIVKHNMIIQKHIDRERKLQKKIEAKEEVVEFIEYLENKISELNEITKNEEDEETIHYTLVRITAINEILLTYKKIIGGKNEN